MNSRKHNLSRLAVLLMSVSPLVAGAAATDPGTDYSTDTTRSYVHDQTSEALNNLNGILCYISSMAPAQMVNLGDYIALVDKNVCEPNDGGGQSSTTNSGTDYTSMIVNSSRADSSSPMIGMVWSDEVGGGGNKNSLFARLSATQAPVLPNDPFGRFRMDFCGLDISGVCTDSGYINSTDTGLSFYSQYTGDWGPCGIVTQERKLQLNASSTAGSGRLSETRSGVGAACANANQPPADFLFAYNANYFRRSEGNGANDTCFSRNLADAEESVWRYGLYDNSTGARIERNSGFPIEYTDTSNKTMNGFVGYWGINTPTPVHATNKVVYRVTYGGGSATKTPYTLKQTGGKLIKYTKEIKTLAQLDKVKFQFWPQTGTANLPTGAGTGGYEAYWDETNKKFVRTGHQDTATWNIIPDTATDILIPEMQTAMPWGLYGWSNMLGGNFAIDQATLAALTNAASGAGSSGATNVTTHTQNVVYPAEFAALGGMNCINNCPTAADIAASNAAPSGSPVQPYVSTSLNWGESNLYSYTLDGTAGNLVDTATAAVVSTATSGNNQWGINSGRLVATADLATLNAARDARIAGPGVWTAGMYVQSDIDALTTYYEWQTGGNSWNQLAYLLDDQQAGATGNPVSFDPPLNVTWTVPNDPVKYGISAGATITLQYGGFGDLWGIPSTCIDMATNQPCTFAVGEMQRWTPEFSIPSTPAQQVTVPYTQGTVTTGTIYPVKALEKEVRLGKLANCNSTGLTLPTAGSITLPVADPGMNPSDPANTSVYIGPMPTFSTQPAPRVIQGEVMY